MCKRVLAVLLVLSIALLSVPVYAAETEFSLGKADLLLLHEEQLSDDQLADLRILADTATTLGESMDIATASQAEALFDHYKMILCYDMQPDAVLAKQLTQSGAKLFLLGGTLLPNCIKAADPTLSVQTVESRSEKGVLQYDFSTQQSYESIVDMPEAFYTLDTSYKSGTLETNGSTYPFCVQSGSIRYTPLCSFTDDLTRAALTREISGWLWEYDGDPPQKGQYFVMDNIYPYMPAQDLLDRVQVLIDANIPFVLSVMPVYANADYPAMQQFCEVLRYAQANGGAVILHAPIIRGEVTDWDAYNEKITEAVVNYTDQNVYPLGFDVPYSWTWNEDTLSWMKRTRTLFVYEDDKQPDFTRDTDRNLLYYNYHALVFPALDLDDGGENSVLQFSAAQRVSADIELDLLRKRTENLQNNREPYYSLWDSSQSVWADNFHLIWQSGALTVNSELRSLRYTPQAKPENFDYKRNLLERFTVSIQNESQGLIVLVAVVTVLFLLLILYARRRQRLHFLYRTDSAPDFSEDTSDKNTRGGGR